MQCVIYWPEFQISTNIFSPFRQCSHPQNFFPNSYGRKLECFWFFLGCIWHGLPEWSVQESWPQWISYLSVFWVQTFSLLSILIRGLNLDISNCKSSDVWLSLFLFLKDPPVFVKSGFINCHGFFSELSLLLEFNSHVHVMIKYNLTHEFFLVLSCSSDILWNNWRI